VIICISFSFKSNLILVAGNPQMKLQKNLGNKPHYKTINFDGKIGQTCFQHNWLAIGASNADSVLHL